MNQNEIDQQRKNDTAIFEDEVKNISQQLPSHKIKEFIFTDFEQQIFAEQQTIITLAEQTKNRFINEICLKRRGLTPSPAIHIRYSVGLGRFVCFIPKLPKVDNTIKKKNGQE